MGRGDVLLKTAMQVAERNAGKHADTRTAACSYWAVNKMALLVFSAYMNGPQRVNPFRAPKSLSILNLGKVVPHKGFQ